jgi:hypothetical protein
LIAGGRSFTGMKNSPLILVVGGALLLLACGGKKQIDYSTTETKATEVVVDEVPVSVNMPSGWKDSPLSLPNSKKWEAPAGTFDGPEITIGATFGMPASVEDAVGQATLGMADGVKRKEKVGDAFVVSTESASGMSFSVHTFVPATEDKTLECSVSYIRASGKIQNLPAQRAWAEKLCLSAKPKAAPQKIEVTAEMNDFLSQFGTGTSIGKALKKHGAKGLDTKDMELFDIKSPKVTKTKKDGALTCYSIDGKAGMTTRSYNVCWSGNKIARIDELGLR